MEGFEPPRRFSTPTSRFSRPFPSTAWVHLQMYSRSNVSRKKERNLERNPDFLLISCRRNPLKTQGKLKNGFQNTLPFSRPFPSTAWVHLQMYSRSNVSRKKGEKLGEKSRFSLNFLSPQPVENTGEIEKRLPKCPPGFQACPVMTALATPHGAPNGCMLKKVITNPPYCQSKNAAVQRFSAERGCIKGIL